MLPLIVADLPQPNIVVVEEIKPTSQDYFDYASSTAHKYGLNSEHFTATIACESQWDPAVRSKAIINGKQENSWGITQINLDNPPTGKGTVKKSQAVDPYFSIEYMARMWAEDKYDAWSCWRNLYG